MENEIIVSEMKMMPLSDAKQNYDDFKRFVKSILKEGLDYGVIPGTPKPTLYKPGAEKLRFVYALGVEFEAIESIVKFDPPFVDYTYRCTIKAKTGQVLAQCEGNCNSEEVKFGYLWKNKEDIPAGIDVSNCLSRTSGKKLEEFEFSIEKAETTGQYGKPAEYWQMWRDAIDANKAKPSKKKTKTGKELNSWILDTMVTQYRIKNPDVIGLKNTIMKMAQKRAFVGAILIATGASEFFTQDLEDMDLNGTGDVYSEKSEDTGITDIDFVDIGDGQQVDNTVNKFGGEWYARIDKCKTAEDVDALGLQYKEEVQANPALRKLLTDTKRTIRKRAEI